MQKNNSVIFIKDDVVEIVHLSVAGQLRNRLNGEMRLKEVRFGNDVIDNC